MVEIMDNIIMIEIIEYKVEMMEKEKLINYLHYHQVNIN
jgi:hypothetical protein